ncbi:hypothetical protein GPK46_03265 [Bifidobacterium adolescentis]|uniref:hypothetical protein n=1 Tax=Bifidobacterium adolescentis TaxID=1680 RepID=UPI001C00A07C|nr:hypothetical protein [Bifidobacterium adolescentis]MBT9853742.1 hypothetical protein [Bifidobacterium adolescentis]
MEHNCVICGKPAEATICEACARDWARRLAWLLKAGMPSLQQIAYKQATTRERSPRHGNTAYAAPPVNETAQALFNAVEVHLQLMGGRLGIKPLGYDRYERARTLMQWADLIRLLLRRMRDLARLEDASGLYADTLRLAERVDAATSHSAEKRLIGVCPDCLNGRDEQGEPVRTPIYAAWDARYAICPACGAWLDLRRTRLEYLRSAGLMHITRTQSDAARWIRANTGVNVSGNDLKNWRARGKMPGTRHIEGPYWAWNVLELLACAQAKDERDHDDA